MSGRLSHRRAVALIMPALLGILALVVTLLRVPAGATPACSRRPPPP